MSDASEKPWATDATKTAWIAATAAVVSALVAFGSAGFSYLNRDRELDIRLVEIGVGILRADPQKSGVSAARQWALIAIEKNSGIEFTPEDRAELLKKPLAFDSGNDWYVSNDGWYRSSDKPIPVAPKKPAQPSE